MADKFLGSLKAGSTSVSVEMVLRSTADGTEVTGKVAADMTGSYLRQGGTRTALSLSNLAAVNSAYASGGVKEVDATNMKGLYRLDLPDAALATGADWVIISVFVTGSYVFYQHYALDTAAEATRAKAVQLTFTNALKVDSAILAAGDFAQAAADKNWLSGSRTLTSFGTLVADTAAAVWGAAVRTLTAFAFTVTAQNQWSESAAGNDTPGTMGELMNAAGVASDPLLNAVPGAYAAGTAGKKLGDLADNTTTINAIDAKTTQLNFSTPGQVDASGGASAATIAAAVWATVLETQGSITAAQIQSIILAVMAGVTTDGGLTMKTPNGGSVRVVAVVNAANERTAITLTPSA